MHATHTPTINARYWTAITLASVFGTNLGDLYAHTSHLGIVSGLVLLCAIAAATFVAERADRAAHEIYYWLVIIIIRTGATNIADYLAFKARIPIVALLCGLAALLCALAWRSRTSGESRYPAPNGLPATDATYWFAMLVAGVLGTALGDACSHVLGQGVASLGLGLALVLVLLWRRSRRAKPGIALYWLVVATARTAGTAIGDWLAENPSVDLGLPFSTLLTGCAFVAIVVLRTRHRKLAQG